MATLQATTVSGTLSASGAAGFDNFIGMIAPFAMDSVPTGWLSCDGSAVSRTTYADLFGKISTTWGTGNGSTTFNVPDLRGAFVRGTGTNGDDSNQVGPSVGAAQAAGNLTHTHTGPNHSHAGPSHTHTGPPHSHTGPSHSHTGPSHTHTGPSHTHTISSSGSHGHTGRGITNAHGYSFQGNTGSRNYTGYPGHGLHSLYVAGGDHTHTTASSGTAATGSSGTGSTGSSGTGSTSQDGTGATGASGTASTTNTGTGATGSNGAANARPYNYCIVYCIKY